MLFIGGVNVAIGYWMQPNTPNPADNQRIELVIPVSTYKFDAPPSDAVPYDGVLGDGVHGDGVLVDGVFVDALHDSAAPQRSSDAPIGDSLLPLQPTGTQPPPR